MKLNLVMNIVDLALIRAPVPIYRHEISLFER